MGRFSASHTETPPCWERRSPGLVSAFSWYARRFTARHFRAVRLSRAGAAPDLPPGPLIVALNHPSWWDPLIGLVLSGQFPDRLHFAPMEHRALGRYRFFERLGFFAIEPGTVRGTLAFVRTGRALLSRPATAIWVTAQGRFADPRERPLRLRRGVGLLAATLAGGTLLPLALEYPFWDERLPEALARYGRPLPIEPGRSSREWTALLGRELEATQDALAEEARRRDPAAFATLLEGRSGTNWIYDLWRRGRVHDRETATLRVPVPDLGRGGVP